MRNFTNGSTESNDISIVLYIAIAGCVVVALGIAACAGYSCGSQKETKRDPATLTTMHEEGEKVELHL